MRLDERLADMVIRAIATAVDPMLERIAVAEARLEMKTAEMVPVLAAVTELTKDNSVLRERLAVVEVKAMQPGPAGKDGADGLGFGDLEVLHDGERTFTLRAVRGDQVKELGSFSVPAMIFRTTFTEGRSYNPGDVVHWGGSSYCCTKATTLKPDFVAPFTSVGDSVEFRGANGKDFWSIVASKGHRGKSA